MSDDLPVIYRATDIAEADIVVHWLAVRDIQAMVRNRFATGTLQVPQAVAPNGVEVCAMDPTQAESAREALARHFQRIDDAVKSGSTESVEAVCEDCGKTSTFEGSLRGRVEQCAYCNAYIDVPE